MYIVKNTGTMVIGVAKELQIDNEDIHTIGSAHRISSSSSLIDKEEAKDGQNQSDPHLFQIVTSDTTVFQDYTKQYYNIEDKEIIKISLGDTVEKHKLREIKEEIV